MGNFASGFDIHKQKDDVQHKCIICLNRIIINIVHMNYDYIWIVSFWEQQ